MTGNKASLHIFLVSGVFWMMFAVMSFLIFQNLTSAPTRPLPKGEPLGSQFSTTENNVNGDSVNVNIENGVVTISGKTVMTNKDNYDLGTAFFISSSSFSQSFSIPNYVDSENVQIANKKNKIILSFPKWSQEV